MYILIETTTSSSRANKYQRGDSFITDENRGKESSPRMVLSRASWTVEILNVRWPFIMWRSKEVQFDWWIKLQQLRVFKDKNKKQVICWYYIQNKNKTIHPEYFDANNVFLHSIIHNLKNKPNMFQDLSI